jgi:hypothetical protein
MLAGEGVVVVVVGVVAPPEDCALELDVRAGEAAVELGRLGAGAAAVVVVVVVVVRVGVVVVEVRVPPGAVGLGVVAGRVGVVAGPVATTNLVVVEPIA